MFFERFRRWRQRRKAAQEYDPYYGEQRTRGHHHGHSSSSDSHDHHHHHHHRGRRGFIAVLTALFTLATFVIFLLVALSIPIIKSIWLFTIQAAVNPDAPTTSIATQLRFGIWGICAVSANGAQQCYGPRLGYSLTEPVNVASLIGQNGLVEGVLKGLTVILVLHPVCAGLAVVVFIFSACLRSHAMSIFELIVATLLAVVGTIVLAIDVALVLFARSKVPDLTNDLFTVEFGNGMWMVVAAVVCSWLSVVALSARACLCCNMNRKY